MFHHRVNIGAVHHSSGHGQSLQLRENADYTCSCSRPTHAGQPRHRGELALASRCLLPIHSEPLGHERLNPCLLRRKGWLSARVKEAAPSPRVRHHLQGHSGGRQKMQVGHVRFLVSGDTTMSRPDAGHQTRSGGLWQLRHDVKRGFVTLGCVFQQQIRDDQPRIDDSDSSACGRLCSQAHCKLAEGSFCSTVCRVHGCTLSISPSPIKQP